MMKTKKATTASTHMSPADEAAMNDDRKFFKRNPHRRARIRPRWNGEFAAARGMLVEDIEEGSFAAVIVRQIAPGVRLRTPCVVDAFVMAVQDDSFLEAAFESLQQGENLRLEETRAWLGEAPYPEPVH